MRKIKAVLFDCDGLMFNTEQISDVMWREKTSTYGIALPEDFFERITGAGGASARQYMKSIPGMEKVLPEILHKRFDLEWWNSFEKGSLDKEGLTELFSYLNRHTYKIAIASSSPKEYVDFLLHHASEELNYDILVTGDMVKNTKPDPEIFIRSASLIGVDPVHCLVLEDSKQGILAANKAGMYSCFIEDTIPADELMKSVMSASCNNLKEVIQLLKEWNGECDEV